MKLFLRHAFILGALYMIIGICVPFLPSIQLLIFFTIFLTILFGSTPSFIRNLNSEHPKISTALCCIGWLPYALLIAICIETGMFGTIFVSGFLLIAYCMVRFYK